MTPILFEANTTAYNTNGIGRLTDALACTVEENLNGLYELTMTYPITGQHYSNLAIERLIVAEPFAGGTWQPFRIYKISRPLNGVVTVHAEHISYLLNKVVVMPFTAASCAEAIANIKTYAANNCPFTFDTDKSALGEMTVDIPRAARGLLGGEQGSLLDVYGKGEYEFDRFNVNLHVNRGTDKGITIRYGKNLTELVRDSDITNTYTGIVPFYSQDGKTLTLPEKIIWSDYRNQFAYDIVKPVDFSQKWQERPTVAQLRAAAQTYVQNNEGWKIADNVTLSFVALWQTEEYKSIANVERVNMGDTVHVIYEALGVEASAEVIRTVYDSLMERYTEIELGTKKNSLATAIQEALDTVSATEATSMISQAVDHAADLITGANGGHVVLGTNADGQPNEIFIMDTADVGTARQVLRINMNGIGFSSNGVDGPYGTAWTLDGHFVANYIYTGKLSARNNNFVLDLDAGTLTMGNKALIITAGNLQLDANGNVKVTGTITAAAGSKIGPWDVSASAITYNNGSYGSTGLYFGTSGISLGNKFKVSAAGVLECTGATVNGTLTAGAGSKIGPWDVSATAITYNNGVYGSSGLYFGTSGISLGNKFKVSSSGVLECSGATVNGTLTAGAGSTIGPWSVSQSALTYNNGAYGTSGIYVGTSGISLGNTFKVSSNGVLECSGATVNGTLRSYASNDSSIYTELRNGHLYVYDGSACKVQIGISGSGVGGVQFSSNGSTVESMLNSTGFRAPTGTINGNFTVAGTLYVWNGTQYIDVLTIGGVDLSGIESRLNTLEYNYNNNVATAFEEINRALTNLDGRLQALGG